MSIHSDKFWDWLFSEKVSKFIYGILFSALILCLAIGILYG